MKKWIGLAASTSAILLLAACQNQNTPAPDNSESVSSQMNPATDTSSEASSMAASSASSETMESQSSEEQMTQTGDPKKDGIQEYDFGISLDDAIKTFKDKYGEMMVYAVELTAEDGVYQYEIKGWQNNTEYKVHIDAENGDILSEKEEDEDGNNMEIDFAKVMDPKKIMDVALKELDDDAYITSWELEEEDGDMAYEVEYDFKDTNKSNGDMTINAYTGDIMEN